MTDGDESCMTDTIETPKVGTRVRVIDREGEGSHIGTVVEAPRTGYAGDEVWFWVDTDSSGAKRVCYVAKDREYEVVDENEPDFPSLDCRTPSRVRRAMRRLQDQPPSDFERVIDLLYSWQEQVPTISVMEIMRKCFQTQHQNINDKDLVKAMEGLIKQVRLNRINAAIDKLGLDDAERLLGLKKGD